jgi:hypothetical protein
MKPIAQKHTNKTFNASAIFKRKTMSNIFAGNRAIQLPHRIHKSWRQLCEQPGTLADEAALMIHCETKLEQYSKYVGKREAIVSAYTSLLVGTSLYSTVVIRV